MEPLMDDQEYNQQIALMNHGEKTEWISILDGMDDIYDSKLEDDDAINNVLRHIERYKQHAPHRANKMLAHVYNLERTLHYMLRLPINGLRTH
jgi:hypothetical protein